jgi:hypothetical protein
MDEISTQKNLNYIENTIITDNKNKLSVDESETQPSENAVKTILDYSKSICVLKSKNKDKTKLCNIN